MGNRGLLILVGLMISWLGASHAAERVDADRETKKAFQELHFFQDGRGMMLSPGLISAYNMFVPGLGMVDSATFKERWGITYNDDGNISGLQNVEYKGHRIGVMGCVVCHSGRAAGQFVVGLGNKNVDVFQMGKDVATLESYWKWLVPAVMKDETYVDLEEASLGFAKYLSNPDIGNLTQGLVPISFIRGWFYRIHGEALPKNMSRGQVKVPFLWGYGEKRKVGQFCDGFGDGTELGWAVAVELAAGQSPEAVRSYYPKVKEAEESFAHFLPPPYPFPVDQELARVGAQIFSQTCIRCHGSYERDAEGQPVFKAPRWIPWELVRTDRDRVAGHSEAFNLLVEGNPLRDILRYKNTQHGYFAPRLEGVWSRFPYLHNGSVPTVADLLSPVEQRPRFFSLKAAGERERFDARRLGLTQPPTAYDPTARDIYDTTRIGHSNQGHEFYTDLDAASKAALIEYLKTL